MKIRFFMKNGTISPNLECAEFIIQKDGRGKIIGWNAEECDIPRPMYIDLEEILMVWRVE
jgi:hypothetical protein